MAALVFFQISAVVILLGAELNRGLIEIRNGASAARVQARSGK
jgi:uncharacterized BrkB/YihY/UPF0761 family membrane protein